MAGYVALLRGINLGARNKVAMPDLRQVVESLGVDDVRTYVQSGNVVFRAPGGRSAGLATSIERDVARVLGVEARVFVRTAAELRCVVEGNPFAERATDFKQLHLTFLEAPPDPESVQTIDGERYAPDELAVDGREIFIYCPNGYGNTKLSNAFFERRLGLAATTRNWRTVTALAELASA